MSIEQQLIKVFIDNKKDYYKYKNHIKEYMYSSEEIKKIIDTIDLYYNEYNTKENISISDLRVYFFIKNKQLQEIKIKLYEVLFDSISKIDNISDISPILSQFIEVDYATRIANTCYEVFSKQVNVQSGEDTLPLKKIQSLVEECSQEQSRFKNNELSESTNKNDNVVSFDLETLLINIKKTGLNWRLKELQLSVGPINKGDFIIIGARPETGKTTLLASEVTNFASQLQKDKKVIWINNEESNSKVILRIIQAALQEALSVIELSPKTAMERYCTIMGEKDKIMVVSDESGYSTTSKLESLFKELSPGLIVIDTLDKIEGFSHSEREDLRLGSIYRWARSISKMHAPVLASSQADASAENAQWIYQHQLRGSKTDKQGEADVIITIGKLHDPKFEYTRWLHVPKNKSQGCSEEKYRHGFFEIKILPEKATYVGYLK